MIRALSVTLLLFASSAQAETLTNPNLAKNDVCGRFEIIHINGIMTDSIGAGENLNRIRQVYGNAYKGHLLTYQLAYNQHRSFLKDVLDSAKQVINLYAMATWDKWVNAVTNGVFSPGMDSATRAAITKAITDAWGFTKPNPYTDQEVNEIMSVFVANNYVGSRIVMVPHSQGNFYASLVYDKLVLIGVKPAKSLGVVGMAVPYSSVRGGNTYLTSANDLVIDSVRIPTLNNVLAATHAIPYAPLADIFGHNLRDTYLAHKPTADAMVALITNKFNGLKTTLPDPQSWIRVRSHSMTCGALPYPYNYPGPYSCNVDVPTFAPRQWWSNVNINFFSTTAIPHEQHAIGTPAGLEAPNRERMKGCYAWYIADRIAVIKAAGYIPPSGFYWPYHLHSGSCGAGFPWQTPYGNPDVAWMIHSADSSKTTMKAWAEGVDMHYNDVEMFPVCSR